MSSMNVFGEIGEQVVRVVRKAVVSAERPPSVASAVVSVPAPAASLAEVDRAISLRRQGITDCDAIIADLSRKLAVPPASRLKTLLAGKPGANREALAEELDGVRAKRERLQAEASELTLAREPHIAEIEMFKFQETHRPNVLTALAELTMHMDAAAGVYAKHAAVLEAAKMAHDHALARSIIHSRRGGEELPVPDERELRALAFFRSTLVNQTPNTSKLQRFHDELTAAGIDLDAKVKR